MTGERRRLFVAVGLEPALGAAVGRLMEDVRRRVSAQAPAARVTWVDPSRLHITLQFIGAVEEPVFAHVLAVLTRPVDVPPFDMALAGTGAFPPRGAPRVIWVGVIEGRERLQAVASEVAERLAAAGVTREDRPFTPHLTVARVRVPAGLRQATLAAAPGAAPIGVQRVDAITLMESTLSPRGPAYRPLQQTPLAAG